MGRTDNGNRAEGSPTALPTDWAGRRSTGFLGELERGGRSLVRSLLPASAYRVARSRYHGLKRAAGRTPGRGRLLPDFLIIGAVKAGTTTLCAWVNEHPYVSPASRKEVNYFGFHFRSGVDWYRAHFPLERERASFAEQHGRPFLTGEASAAYLSDPWVPERVADALPDVKLVVALRDPVERAHSHFQMSRRAGEEPLDSFEEALAAENERLRPEIARVEADPGYFSWPLGAWSYKLRSRYAEHLERWLDIFPLERFHFVRTEDMASRPAQTLAGVYRFLALPEQELGAYSNFHVGDYAPMRDETRSLLADYFRVHNERLYELVGIDFGWDSSTERSGLQAQ